VWTAGEILALRWSDIDWDHSCIRVNRAYVYGKFGLPKSSASKKPVPLRPLLADSLQAWRKETPYQANDDLSVSELSVERPQTTTRQHAGWQTTSNLRHGRRTLPDRSASTHCGAR
jgi:integrase